MKSLAHPAHPVPEETRERGACAGCGTTEKALTAPKPNARDYEGPMYCLSCNPRFFTGSLEMHFSCLERMDA
ncbi:hypothetical protein BH24ACT19_BH24ACT19_21570 [soil metagenome]